MRELTAGEIREIRKLATSMCANYDNYYKECLLLNNTCYMTYCVAYNSNLAQNGVPIAFSFDSDFGFSWQGEYYINVDDLFNNAQQPPESQFERATKLIIDVLAGGAVESVKIIQMAEEQGISAKTLNRAKAVLGVSSVKRNGQWFWEMPLETQFTHYSEDSQDSQDGQTRNMSFLTIFKKESGVI